MRIRRIRTFALLGFLAGCEASSGWQTPSFPTTLEDVRAIRRATESSLGVTSSMRPDDTSGRPPGIMTPAQQRVALEARIDQLESLVTAQLQASGAGLPGTPVAAGNPSGGGATAGGDPAQDARLEESAQAVAAVGTQLSELPVASTSRTLEQIERNLVDLSSTVTDLELGLLRVDDEYAAKFIEVSQKVQTLAGAPGEAARPQAAVARTDSTLTGGKLDLKLWGLLLGIPSAIALLGGWLFSRTGRSRSATMVEHIERRIDDVDERQARLEEHQREALPLGKRGAYIAGSGAVSALRRSEDPVDREAADFFTSAEAETKPLAQQEAEEFFAETAGEAPALADEETSFTLQPVPAPEPVERFELTREAFGTEPENVPDPENQWQAGAGDDTLEARLARGIQERYFAENGVEDEDSANITSGAIDWDETTRSQAEERASMAKLNEPIAKPDSNDDPTDPPWAPLTAETERLESEEAGWRDLARRGADEAARYADGALDDEEQGSDNEPDLV